MPEFIVELFVPRARADAVEAVARRARVAAEMLGEHTPSVRFLRSIFVPEDETCFLLYEADTEEAVRRAVETAALPFDRIAKTVAAGATG